MQFTSQTKHVKNKMIDSLASPVLLCGGGKEKCEKGKMATKSEMGTQMFQVYKQVHYCMMFHLKAPFQSPHFINKNNYVTTGGALLNK